MAQMGGALLVIGPNFDDVGWGAVFPALAALFHGLSALMARKWANAARLPVFQYYTAITAVIMMTAIFIFGGITGYDRVALVMQTHSNGFTSGYSFWINYNKFTTNAGIQDNPIINYCTISILTNYWINNYGILYF